MLTSEQLVEKVGETLGVSEWCTLTQERIAAFADVTEDWQAIHLDAEAGRAAGFDGPVAHGYLSLSLLSKMSYEALPKIAGQIASINYGFDRIRFLAPVQSGARIRARFSLQDIERRSAATIVLVLNVSMEIEGAERPALIAAWRVLIQLDA